MLENTTQLQRDHSNYFFLFIYSYRQAQATVLEALPLLNRHSIATKRPEDYFAEMAKSDQHMQKVSLVSYMMMQVQL